MIRFKSVTLRTQLILDLILFALFSTVVISALAAHAAPHTTNSDFGIWDHVHALLGIALTLVIALHLLMHQSWITFQVRRLFRRLVAHH